MSRRPRRRTTALVLTAAAGGLLLLGIAALRPARSPLPGAPMPESTLDLLGLLGSSDVDGFARAIEPRSFAFPRDHLPHPDFRSEWWYFTGNLDGADGRRYGYQLTLFRNALAADQPARSSRWASRQVWMGHLAVSDIERGRFHSFERFSREALGLAGARAEPFRVWLEDWSIEAAQGSPPPFRLRAAAGDVALDLELDSLKPVVLQGDEGLSRKGSTPGNASYYYSYTRLATGGILERGGEAVRVTGTSWMDREWSTSALEPGQVGWDWFSLQLLDGRELMYYRLRTERGGTHPLSGGVLVAVDGSTRRLGAPAVALEELDRWRSPETGVDYPAGWRLTLPASDLSLEISPLLAHQEMRLSVRYWEGAVEVKGTAGGRPIAGRGYVELAGY